MSNITFLESLEKYKSVYFHFLDGYINPDIGDSIGNIKNFIKNHNLVTQSSGNNINILECELTDKISFANINLKFTNISNNTSNNININFTQSSTSLLKDQTNINNLSITLIQELRKQFNYCIYQIPNDDHATSILIFEKNNKLFLHIINSGAGLENNNNTEFNGQTMYTPYFGIVLCDDTTNIDNLKLGIKRCLTILQIPFLYTLIKKPLLMTHDIPEKINMGGIEGFNIVTYINFNEIYIILKNLKTFFPLIELNKFDIDIKLNSYNYNYGNLNFTSIYEIYEKNIIDIKLIGYKDTSITVTVPYEYYKFSMKILQNSMLIEFNLNQININNLDKYNNTTLDIYRNNDKIIDAVINKLIFHNINNNLYIYTQESGSCSWFSIYWPIILYNIFIEDDKTKYCEQIKKINTECYNIVNNIFDSNNFSIEYSREINSNFEYMKILCNKFIDIQLLSKDILFNEVDFIFNKTLKFNINQIPIFDKIINKPINYDQTNIDKLININIDKEFNQNFLICLLEDYNNRYNKNNLLLDSYKLFLFIESNNINIFSLIKITSNNNIINDLIVLINEQFFDQTVIKPNSANVTPRYNTKEYIISQISDFDISNFLNYENLFNETYDYDINKTTITTPAYFNDYIHIAMFLNQSSSQNHPMIFDFDKNRVNLIKFIIFLHRFNMFIRILNEIHTIIFKCSKFIYPGLDFGLLVGNKLYNSIIKYYINYSDNIKFTKNFINSNIILLPVEYKYLINYIPESINCIKELEEYNGSIDDYKIVRNFFYKYPKYLYQTFNGKKNINYQTFIHLNIYDIFKEENLEYRDNLIYYFIDLWNEKKNKNKEKEALDIILFNLQLLIFKYPNSTINNTNNSNNFDTLLTYVSGKENILKREEFNNELKGIYKSIEDKLNKDEKDNIKMIFYKHIVDNKDNLLDKSKIIKKLIKKYIPDVIFTETNKIIINKKEFVRIELNNSLLKDLFTIDDENHHYYLIDDVIDVNSLKICRENTYNSIKLYRISNKMCIEMVIDIYCKNGNTSTSIKDIRYNNCYVIKYNDIVEPFKYVIPTNCFHFIYKQNNIYYITYLKRKLPSNMENLLGINNLYVDTYTFSINPNTLFYFSKMDQNEFNNLVKICKNYQINKYNILYIHNYDDSIKTGYYYNKKCYELMDFNWKDIWNNKINEFEYPNINFLNKVEDDNLITIEYIKKDLLNNSSNTVKIIKSIKHLLNKISKCEINTTIKNEHRKKFSSIIKDFNKYSKKFNEDYIKNNSISYFLSNYNYLYEYLTYVKIYNFLNKLLESFDNEQNICSLIKINNELFNVKKQSWIYKFEALFELISGYELLEEQMERYTEIVNNFIDYENQFKGRKFPYHDYKQKNNSKEPVNIINVKYTNNLEHIGGDFSYPLHHFMMGKGKSAMITPLLSICFANYNKKIIIIVPDHLKNQTEKTMLDYINIFRLSNDIEISSDSEIKEKFLKGYFSNSIQNSNKVMLIDEFDSVLDPIKSNFNITEKKDLSVTKLYIFLLSIVKKIKTDPESEKNIKKLILETTNTDFTRQQLQYLSDDVSNIYEQIKNNILKENINWGIHPNKCYAIPYMNKDKPLIKSNFTSSIITVFLTLYYYIILKDYTLNTYLTKFLIKNNMIREIFKADIPNYIITNEYLNSIVEKLNIEEKIKLFDKILNKIFNGLSLSQYQYNTSFVDIINIDKIFKVGYSGTINVTLPPIKSKIKFDIINYDEDENINVKYAILESKIIKINNLKHTQDKNLLFDLILKNDILNNYDALIDTIGLFKNIKNEEIAEYLYNNLTKIGSKKRDIIFLDEKDNKLTCTSNMHDSSLVINNYNEYIKYFKPFIYYSQSHIVGIDIKQDNYPIMKGLCIIDSKTVYTDVAQSIFRLRKINLGHTIDFIYIDDYNNLSTSDKTSDEIYSLLKLNDTQNVNSKKDFLTYQTIKSEIRKNRPINNEFKKVYEEVIKYYYSEQIPDYKNTNLFLKGIFTLEEIVSNNLEHLFSEINNEETLLSLVYGINSNIIQNQQNEQEQEQEQREEEREEQEQREKKIEKKIEQSTLMYDPSNNSYPILSWNFNNYNILTNIDMFYKTFVIEINDLIGFLPNIFCNNNYYNYYNNKSGIALLYIKINSKDKFIIIPGYTIPYLIDKYPIVDINIKVINKKFIQDITTELIDKLNNDPIIQIINSNINININLIDSISLLIGSNIICDYHNSISSNSNKDLWLIENYKYLNETVTGVIHNIRSKLSVSSSRYKIKWINFKLTQSWTSLNSLEFRTKDKEKNIKKQIFDLYNITTNYDGKGGSITDKVNFKNKYLKYKNKYLKLKVKLNI